MSAFILIILSAVFTNNFITVKTYGICPFLGVSKKTSSAVGMGIAVTVVMVLATLVTYPVYNYVMVAHNADGTEIWNFQFLWIIFFIFIIASLVQMLEMIIRKISPSLYNSMGVYLPLITTNCAVLGVALTNVTKEYGILESVVNGLATAVGFFIAICIMAGIREKIEYNDIPKPFQGTAIVLITACLMSIAFMGFSGII